MHPTSPKGVYDTQEKEKKQQAFTEHVQISTKAQRAVPSSLSRMLTAEQVPVPT